MKVSEIRAILDEKDAWEDLELIVSEQGCATELEKKFTTKTGLSFEFVQLDGDMIHNVEYSYRFKVADRYFESGAQYNSWDSDDRDIEEMVCVQPKQVLVTIYEEVKD